MEGRFTEEELAIAKSVDLCAVAESLGYTVKKIGKYHTLKEMDSIRIYDRSHWYRWSRQFDKGNNGGSQIDFLRVFGGMSVKEAVFWLLDFAGYRRIESTAKQPLVHQVTKKQQEERRPFVLPQPAGDNSYLISYLNNERGISKAVIELFLKENLIYESRHYHNIVFKGNDKNGVSWLLECLQMPRLKLFLGNTHRFLLSVSALMGIHRAGKQPQNLWKNTMDWAMRLRTVRHQQAIRITMNGLLQQNLILQMRKRSR